MKALLICVTAVASLAYAVPQAAAQDHGPRHRSSQHASHRTYDSARFHSSGGRHYVRRHHVHRRAYYDPYYSSYFESGYGGYYSGYSAPYYDPFYVGLPGLGIILGGGRHHGHHGSHYGHHGGH